MCGNGGNRRAVSVIAGKQKASPGIKDESGDAVMNLTLCVDIGVCSVLLYKLTSWLNVIAHEHGEYFVGFCGILNRHLF